MKRTPALLIPLLLAGCTISEERFPDVYARAVCHRLKDCQRSDYDRLWTDESACEQDWADAAQTVLDAASLLGQTYDPAAGASCVQDIRGATCADVAAEQADCSLFN